MTDTYTGVSLWNLVQDARLLTHRSIKNDLLNFVVVATGSGGYRAAFSLGEIDPAFGNQQDIVAYADQKGRLGSGGGSGAMRIIVPRDVGEGRYVSNLAELQAANVTAFHSA